MTSRTAVFLKNQPPVLNGQKLVLEGQRLVLNGQKLVLKGQRPANITAQAEGLGLRLTRIKG